MSQRPCLEPTSEVKVERSACAKRVADATRSRACFAHWVCILTLAMPSVLLTPALAAERPSIDGIWKVRTEYSVIAPDLMPTVDGKEIPLQPWNEALWRGAIYAEKVLREAWPPNNQRCLVAGTLRAMKGVFPWRLIVTDEQVTLLFEEDGRTNIWPFRASHLPDLKPTWYGDPIAKWEGDSLVVDIVGTNGKTPWPHSVHHTTQLHHVYKVRTIDGGKALEVKVWIDDQGAFTRPWETVAIFDRMPSDYKLREYRCAENNREFPPVLGFWGSEWGPR